MISKSFFYLFVVINSLGAFAQESKGSGDWQQEDQLAFEELNPNFTFLNIDSIQKNARDSEEEQLNQELKNRGLENFTDESPYDKAPVKYYIVLKSFNSLPMAKKYIENMESAGIVSLKIWSEKNIHRIYHAIAYHPEEANKLKEKAKTIETEAWIVESSF